METNRISKTYYFIIIFRFWVQKSGGILDELFSVFYCSATPSDGHFAGFSVTGGFGGWGFGTGGPIGAEGSTTPNSEYGNGKFIGGGGKNEAGHCCG